jgi:hypothetical protein
MKGFYMINDPGGESNTQVKTRFFFFNGNASGQITSQVDILTNGNQVPSSVSRSTSLTNVNGLGAYSIYQQRISKVNLDRTIRYSNDYGATWATGSMSPTPNTQGRSIEWVSDLDLFVTSGLSGSSPYNSAIWTSKDGITYTKKTMNGLAYTPLNHYFYFYGYSPLYKRIVAVNNFSGPNTTWYSDDRGENWIPGTYSGGSIDGGVIEWVGTHFLIGRAGTNNTNCLLYSLNGSTSSLITATGLTPVSSSIQFNTIAYNPYIGTQGKGRVIMARFSGNSNTDDLAYSDDGGFNWTKATVAAAAYYFEGATYDPVTNMFFVGARHPGTRWAASVNGINWTIYSGLTTPGSYPIPVPLQ